MFAETIASNINWTLIFTIVMAMATLGMWWDAKKTRVTEIKQPLVGQLAPLGNSELQMSVKQLNARVKVLEQWRSDLIEKMDADKTEVINAGEHRAEKLHERINLVLTSVSELKGTVHEMQRHQNS